MTRYINPVPQYLDSKGKELSGGKLYFYDSGSATKKKIWSDPVFSVQLPNPVTLYGDGRIPSIFLKGSYRVVLTDADGQQIWERDPVSGTTDAQFGADWSSIVTYDAGDVVREGDSYWISLTGGNTNNRPSTDGGANWEEIVFYQTGDLVGSLENYAAVRSLNGSNFAQVSVAGHTSAGDGGGGHFYADLSDTTTADNGGTVLVDAGGIRWKYIGYVTAKTFGAGLGTYSDDTAALGAYRDYIQSLPSGGDYVLPSGSYGTTSTIVFDGSKAINIVGDGEATKCKVLGTPSNTHFFKVGNNTTPNGQRSSMKSIMFVGPDAGTSRGIFLQNQNVFKVDECKFQLQDVGIELDRAFATEIISNDFDVCTRHAIVATTAAHNTIIERNNFFTCGVGSSSQAVAFTVATDNVGIKGNDFEFCYVNIKAVGGSSFDITGNYMEYHEAACFDFTGPCYAFDINQNWIALGDSVGGGSSQTIQNITGGTFKNNTIYNQSITFDSATLLGFDVGYNRHTGTGSVGKQPFISPTLLNSWAQQANYSLSGYRKDSEGYVELKGAYVSGTAPSVIFNLPAGYRPSEIRVFATQSANGLGRITVQTNGDVEATVAASNNPCIDGIRFYVG